MSYYYPPGCTPAIFDREMERLSTARTEAQRVATDAGAFERLAESLARIKKRPDRDTPSKCTCVVSKRGVVLRPNPNCPAHRLRVMGEEEWKGK